jgi:glutathione S-transferase
MADLHLFIGNKNYSSWSLRPWIALTVKDISFEEHLVPFDFGNGNRAFADFSPSGKVPVLRDGDLVVWESLAILEYLADRFPEAGLWPEQRGQRAVARAISAEMHSGFQALRSACPMNMRRIPAALPVGPAVKADVARIEAIWTDALETSGGPFLFGSFTNADAMFAPVVNRFRIYELARRHETRDYMDRVQALPAWRSWEEAGRAEPWIVPEDEV